MNKAPLTPAEKLRRQSSINRAKIDAEWKAESEKKAAAKAEVEKKLIKKALADFWKEAQSEIDYSVKRGITSCRCAAHFFFDPPEGDRYDDRYDGTEDRRREAFDADLKKRGFVYERQHSYLKQGEIHLRWGNIARENWEAEQSYKNSPYYNSHD